KKLKIALPGKPIAFLHIMSRFCYLPTSTKRIPCMNENTPSGKLNARRSLILISILYLVNAAIGTLLAVQGNLPSEFFGKDGKPALEDFLIGNGTALSPPLYLCIVAILLIVLAFHLRRLGT